MFGIRSRSTVPVMMLRRAARKDLGARSITWADAANENPQHRRCGTRGAHFCVVEDGAKGGDRVSWFESRGCH